jgi:hypothetical protein
MKGALVFVAVFAIFLLATIAYSELPPGAQIYDSLHFPAEAATYKVFDTVPGRTLISALFNGVIFGIVAWLIYTIAHRATKPKTQQPQK